MLLVAEKAGSDGPATVTWLHRSDHFCCIREACLRAPWSRNTGEVSDTCSRKHEALGVAWLVPRCECRSPRNQVQGAGLCGTGHHEGG